MAQKKIIVIGGGASGLMAAGVAATNGAHVILLEKMKTPARKIRITGKGRCNITNTAPIVEFIDHFGKSGRFLRQAFGRFFSGELIAFFEKRGLKIGFERGGRVFPADGDAPLVARLLVDWVKEAGVDLRTEISVVDLLVKKGQVAGVVCGHNQKIYADAVILATGGASYPRTGSTGDGYRLAQSVGHTIVTTRPALVPLRTAERIGNGLAGLQLKNINARLFINGKRKAQAFGELSFTKNGLSGPIILTLSSLVVDALRSRAQVAVILDLKPALDDAKLEARMQRDLQKRPHDPMSSFLRGLMPRELIQPCLDYAQIDHNMTAVMLPAQARKKIRHWLKNFRFEITGYGSLEEAIVTAGGVKTAEIDPCTMESKKSKRLYIVGELLDIQADTGGYNLQAAFSTGWVAGKAVCG